MIQAVTSMRRPAREVAFQAGAQLLPALLPSR